MLAIDEARRRQRLRRLSMNMSGMPGGFDGLTVAIIRQAVHDAMSRDPLLVADALAYLSGPVYRDHVTALGLPPTWLPEGVRYAID